MNLHQLKYAVEVDRQKSITRAAKSLFVSQPAVSTAIKELEDELKMQIFARTSAGVETTEAGRAFVAGALDVLRRTDMLGRLYDTTRPDSACTLRIAGPPADSCVSALVSMLKRGTGCEGFKLSYLNQLVFDVIDSVEKGAADIGILSYKNCMSESVMTVLEQKGLEYSHISSYPLCLAVGEGHPLTCLSGELRYSDLVKYPMAYMDSAFHQNTLKAIAEALGEPAAAGEGIKTIQVIDIDFLIRLMREAGAVTVLCSQPFDDEATYGRGIVRLPGTLGGLTEERGWIKRRDCTPPACANLFLDYVRKYFTTHRMDGA